MTVDTGYMQAPVHAGKLHTTTVRLDFTDYRGEDRWITLTLPKLNINMEILQDLC